MPDSTASNAQEIAIQCIEKRFGKVVAADQISHRFDLGSTTAIAGFSGAGKSTLLRIIAGLEPADRGQVLINGQDSKKIAPAKRGIAYLNQEAALYPQHTLVRNLELSLAALKMPKDELRSRIDEALEALDLNGLESRTPAQLSGGQRQRAALAKALARRAATLLLDEPFSQLDVANRTRLREYIRSIQQSTSPTMILVSHDPLDAQLLADSMLVLDQGKLIQSGTPSDVYHAPNSLCSLELTSPLGLNRCTKPLCGLDGSIDRPLVFRPDAVHLQLTEDDPQLESTQYERGSIGKMTDIGNSWLVDVAQADCSITAVVQPETATLLEEGRSVHFSVHHNRAWRLSNSGDQQLVLSSEA